MKIKHHETPEFQVIRRNEANAKFFVASIGGSPSMNGWNEDGGSSSYYGFGDDE